MINQQDFPTNMSYEGPEKPVADALTVLRVIYGVIGSLAIMCNGLLCYVILKEPRTLIKSYNILVFALAITDTVTGFFLVSSPTFVIGNNLMPIPSGVKGEFFCRFIQRNFFIWALANFSVAVVVTMALERWYAIARPAKYQLLMRKRNTVKYVLALLVFSITINIPQLFETHLEVKGLTTVCVANFIAGSKMVSLCYTILYCMIAAFIPFSVILATYLDLRCVVIPQRLCLPQNNAQIQRNQKEIALLRMTAIVASCLGISIIPDKIIYFLFWSDLVTWEVLHVTAVLCMLNSVINPWIYCCTNKTYRKVFVKTLLPNKWLAAVADSQWR